MSKHVRWLIEQTEQWVNQGIVSREQAETIRQLYPEQKAGLPWGVIVFTGIGSVIVGLGVILLFAYNWHAMPKFAKLAVIFASIAGAHGSGILLARYDDWRRQLGDAMCLMGTMLFGAGIWLVAQIYNINEHYPNAFLVWCVGAAAIAWAFPSIAQGVVATVLMTIWICCEAWDFQTALTWAPLIVICALGTLAWRLRSRLLLLVVLVSMFVAMISVSTIIGGLPFSLVMNTAALIIACGILANERGWFEDSGAVWAVIGWPALIVCLYILTFNDVVHECLQHVDPEREGYDTARVLYTWLPFALSLAAWCMVAWTRFTRPRPAGIIEHSYELALVPAAATAAQLFSCANLNRGDQLPATILFNVLFLALAFAWMGRGCQRGGVRQTAFGSVMFLALAAGRYFDLFDSLAARGLVFLIVGGLLFAEGILFMRARRRVSATEVRQ